VSDQPASRAPADTVLTIENVEAGYGRAALVLRGLTIHVARGEVVCLVGPNGAGKSTVLKVASGMLPPRSGRVVLHGEDVSGLRPEELLGRGLAHVLQGHSVFGEMTVGENIRMGGYTLRDKALVKERVAAVKDVFPIVHDRWSEPAGVLSGGQQKMVEFGRALMLDPDVVLLDEPSMGLDPKTTTVVFEQVDRLRQLGKGVLLVEQNARRALEMADRGCVLDLGRIHVEGVASDLLADPELGSLYLGGRPHATTAATAGPAPAGPAAGGPTPTGPAATGDTTDDAGGQP
jgi:branched-chain amino acid transport system ATP-binding protein